MPIDYRRSKMKTYADTAPYRGPVIVVEGWSISQVSYEILVYVLGQNQAKEHCRVLARKGRPNATTSS